MRRQFRSTPFLLPLLAAAAPAGAISITFDYSHDTTGFFSDPARKAILNQAAGTFAPFTDSLSAITPTSTNHWTASFLEPTNTVITATAADLAVASNTLTIFVGASDLPGSTLGLGGPGGYSYSGVTTSFANAVNNRGQTNDTGDPATATDFGRWGGAISFDSLTNWFFGSTTSGMTGSQSDFLSVATHEIGHVLGFGTADSFEHYTSGTNFVGPVAQSKHSGTPVPLNTSDLAHWTNGTSSILPGTSTSQETAMDPSITTGTRKLFTILDYAGMSDIGWQVPASYLTAAASLKGDVNGDGFVNSGDINAFIFALSNSLSAFQAQYPSGAYTNADVNGASHAGDGFVNAADINPFIAILSGTGEPGLGLTAFAAVPEPTTAFLLIPAAVALRLRRRR